MVDNGLMMQYFEGFMSSDVNLWKQAVEAAKKLSQDGVTSVWLPPAYKGALGQEDSGYRVYDLYDLGEFNQKGSVRTKYGTKKQYLDAVEAFHKFGINVYADVVVNHKYGADRVEKITAAEFNSSNRCQMIGDGKTVGAWTGFDFPGRKDKYSDFKWNWKHFKGIDWDKQDVDEAVARYSGKDEPVDSSKFKEKFDFIMGADIDLTNREVYDELVNWAVWYVRETGVDGFRLDAVKETPAAFYRDFLYRVRELTGRELFAAGEYWQHDINRLMDYIDEIKSGASLFDVPLHHNFYDCSKAHGAYDLRKLFDGTLSQTNPIKTVTFVDNHNTQPGQIMESFVEDWFKPMAYAIILLRNEGYPCVFYGDYYGIPTEKYKGMKTVLSRLMKLRKNKAYGAQHDYFDDPDCIGWTREGDADHKDSGLAVVLSDGRGGTKRMYIGRQFAGAHFSDVMGNAKYNIKIDNDGFGEFYVNRGAVSVWVRKEARGESDNAKNH